MDDTTQGLDGSGRSGKSSRSKQQQQQQQQQHADKLQLRQSSSIGSSSAGSRRRAKEKSNQLQKKELLKQRRGSRDYSLSNNTTTNTTTDDNGSTTDTTSRSDRITTIREVGGDDFVEELAPVNNIYNYYNTTAAKNRYLNQSQQQQQQQRIASPQQSQGGGGRIPNNTANNNTTNNNNRAVLHACDDKGRCIFHPHIQLRKKAIMGVLGGWKDIRRVCPDCERQEFMQELMAREASEIQQMERILDQMEQLDVEYLNDSLTLEYNGAAVEEYNGNVYNIVGSMDDASGGDGSGSQRSSSQRSGSQRNNNSTTATSTSNNNNNSKGRTGGGGGGLEPPGDLSRRSSLESKTSNKSSNNKERNPARVELEKEQQLMKRLSREQQLMYQQKQLKYQKQQQQQQKQQMEQHQQKQPKEQKKQKQQKQQQPPQQQQRLRRQRSSSPKDRNSNGQSRIGRTLSPKKDRNGISSTVGKHFYPAKKKKNRSDIIDDDDSYSSYSASSSSTSSSYQRKLLKKEKRWKKMMKKKTKKKKKNKSSSNTNDAISTYISSGIPDVTPARSSSPLPPPPPLPIRSKPKQRIESRRRIVSSNNINIATPPPTPPPQHTQSDPGGSDLLTTKEKKSFKLMKDVNKSVSGILREGKKRSMEIKKQIIRSSFRSASSMEDEYDSEEDEDEERSYYSSESYSSSDSSDDEMKGRNNSYESNRDGMNQHRKSDPTGSYGGALRAPRPVAIPPKQSQSSAAERAKYPPPQNIKSGGPKRVVHRQESVDSAATFTDLKRDTTDMLDLHASLTQLPLGDGIRVFGSKADPIPEDEAPVGFRNGSRKASMTLQDLHALKRFQGNNGFESSFNSSATFTDAKQEQGEIVDLHISLAELDEGHGMHASLTELTGASYNEIMLKKATTAATNNAGFHDSSATFTDHSRDLGEIVDMHSSLTSLQGPSNPLQRIESDNSSETYTDYESDMDEMQSLHASFTQLRGPLNSADSISSSSVDDNASFTDICLDKVRKSGSGAALLEGGDDNASFTDICLNMIRKPDSGAAEMIGEEDIDDDASFTDICINMVLRRSDSDAAKQQSFRAKAQRSLSFDDSDDVDMSFDSDKFSYQNQDMLQVPPKPSTKSSTKNAARRRAERWEQARRVFSAKIEEERMKEEGIKHPKKTDKKKPQWRVSFSDIVKELRPQHVKPAKEMTEEDRTRLRAELWKQARILFSEQIAEEERITKKKLEKQILAEQAEVLRRSSSNASDEPKMEELSSTEVGEQQQQQQQQTIEASHEATPAATTLEQDTEASSTEQSLSEQGSEKVDETDVAAGFSSSVVPTIDRLDSQQADLTDVREQSEVTGASSLDSKLDSRGDQNKINDADDQEEQLDSVKRTEPKTFEVTHLPYTGNFGESGMYTGTVNEKYQPSGKGIMMYDNGEELKGHWKNGDFIRESELYSDTEDDGEEDDEEDDLYSSMADVGAKRDRSRSRSKSKDRHVAKSPPRPTFNIGDTGKKSDMITDKDAAIELIEKLTFGEGAFIRRSDGNWTYAEVKSFEETPKGRSSIRFIVNQKNSSKSYAKKYWKTHIRPLKIAPKKNPSSSGDRRGRGRNAVDNINSSSTDESNRGTSCPPVQSRLSFDWPNRGGRSRSRSLRRALSASPMRALHSISEIAKEEEAGEE